MDVKFLHMEEGRRWYLDMETTPSEDVMKIVETTTKDLVYSTPNLGGLWDHWKFENIQRL